MLMRISVALPSLLLSCKAVPTAPPHVLAAEGIRVNVTLCFQPVQALLAAKAGAAYISPFLGRIDDIGGDGMELVEQIVEIYANYPALETQVLAASIRSPEHLVNAALAGAHVATTPYGVLVKSMKHPLTDIGNERFLADWASVPNNDIVALATDWLARRR